MKRVPLTRAMKYEIGLEVREGKKGLNKRQYSKWARAYNKQLERLYGQQLSINSLTSWANITEQWHKEVVEKYTTKELNELVKDHSLGTHYINLLLLAGIEVHEIVYLKRIYLSNLGEYVEGEVKRLAEAYRCAYRGRNHEYPDYWHSSSEELAAFIKHSATVNIAMCKQLEKLLHLTIAKYHTFNDNWREEYKRKEEEARKAKELETIAKTSADTPDTEATSNVVPIAATGNIETAGDYVDQEQAVH